MSELERGPVTAPLTGSIEFHDTRHGDYLALVIDGRTEIIAHQSDGPTIRVDLIEDAQPGEHAVDHGVMVLLGEGTESSVVAGGDRVAVAFELDGNRLARSFFLADGDEEAVPFSHWPPNLERGRARPVARFLLRLLRENQRFHHVHERRGLLVACLTLNGAPARPLAEFVLHDLDAGVDAGRVEWDRHACDDTVGTESLLDALGVIVSADPATTSGRLFGYSTKTNGVIGLLRGKSGETSAEVLYSVDASGPNALCEGSLSWKHPARDPLTDWLTHEEPCGWLLASDSRVLARAGDATRLFDRDRPWTIEPWPSNAPLSEEHGQEVLNWFLTEDEFKSADCRSMRHGVLDDDPPGGTRILAAWVPCVGLAFWRDGVLKTTLRSVDHDRPSPSLAREQASWLVPYFAGSSDGGGPTYELTVGEVLAVTTTATKTRLFVWGETKCAAALPGGNSTADRVASIRDLLPDGGPDSTWKDPSFVRETWASVKQREVAVLSRRKSEDCRKDFLTPPDLAAAGDDDYTHFASEGGTPTRPLDSRRAGDRAEQAAGHSGRRREGGIRKRVPTDPRPRRTRGGGRPNRSRTFFTSSCAKETCFTISFPDPHIACKSRRARWSVFYRLWE